MVETIASLSRSLAYEITTRRTADETRDQDVSVLYETLTC